MQINWLIHRFGRETHLSRSPQNALAWPRLERWGDAWCSYSIAAGRWIITTSRFNPVVSQN